MDTIKEVKTTRLTEVSINKARSDFIWEEQKFVENYDKVVNEQKDQNHNNLIRMNQLNSEIYALFKQIILLFNNFKTKITDNFWTINQNKFKKIEEYNVAFELLQEKQNKFINVNFEDFRDLTISEKENSVKQVVHNLITKATIFKNFNTYKMYKYLLLKKLGDLTESEFLNVMIIRKFLGSPKFIIVNSTFWIPKMNYAILKIFTKYINTNGAAAVFITNSINQILKSTTRAISFDVDSFIEWGNTTEITTNPKHPVTQNFFNKYINKYFENSKLDYKIWEITPNHFIQCSANNYFSWVKKHPAGYIPTIELSLMGEVEETKLKNFQKITTVEEFIIIDVSSRKFKK